jgi:hypothetical protein
MQRFRTEITIEKAPQSFALSDTFLTIGSCFSDTIGQQLHNYKLRTLVNPFGTMYNPESIHKALRYALFNQPPAEHTYLTQDDLISNYDFHSTFSSPEKRIVEKKLTEGIGISHYFLKEADWLLITYGTSWIYTRKDTGETVANCHKVPGHHFDKQLLTQKKILESFDPFYQQLKSFNKNIQLILTVSPVRHINDTLPLNNVSKSTLRLVCHTLTEQHPDIHYFPAYELLLDDLRDYRFYKSDMIHPSEDAEIYVWEKFVECYADDNTNRFIEEWKTIQTKLNHRPFHPTSPAHQSFLRGLLVSLEELKSTIDVEKEIAWVKEQLD